MRTGNGLRVMAPAAVAACAIALALLGILNLAYGDFLLQWQPAPKHAAWRTPVAYLSGLLLLGSGIGLLIPSRRQVAALVASVWIGLWVVLLHLPATIAARGNVAVLLGLAECGAMALGICTLALKGSSQRSSRIVSSLFGVCLIVFGLSHFVYADFTATMVPAWLPAPLAIAYLTGAIHALAGACLVIGFLTRLAATVEALMMSSFVVLLHIPHVIADPHNRLELTMLGVALLLTSAAWLIATQPRQP